MVFLRHISTQLQTIACELQDAAHQQHTLWRTATKLQQSIQQIELLRELMERFTADLSVSEVADVALNVVWQRAPLTCAVVILADSELGPYHYLAMKGISNPWHYTGKSHPLTLTGLVARALLQPLDSDKPGYVYLHDMALDDQGHDDEFPWLVRHSSLLVVPIRTQAAALGVLVLSRSCSDGFDEELCQDYLDIATYTAMALQHAQIRQEMRKNMEQLVNAQLLTRAITGARRFDEVIHRLIQTIPEVTGEADVTVLVNLPLFADLRLMQRSGGATLHFFSASAQSTVAETALAPELYQLVSWVLKAGQSLFYDPASVVENPEHAYYNDSGRALLIPIMIDDSPIGVIHIVAPQRAANFDETDLIVLRTIANTAAIALRAAQMYEQHLLSF